MFACVRSPHAALAPVLERTAAVGARAAALATLGAIGTRASAMALVVCVMTHGWPREVYSRVFDELRNLARFADVLYPALPSRKGVQIGPVTDAFAGAVGAAARSAGARLDVLGAIDRAPARGTASAGRETVRHLTGALLDLAGYVPGKA